MRKEKEKGQKAAGMSLVNKSMHDTVLQEAYDMLFGKLSCYKDTLDEIYKEADGDAEKFLERIREVAAYQFDLPLELWIMVAERCPGEREILALICAEKRFALCEPLRRIVGEKKRDAYYLSSFWTPESVVRYREYFPLNLLMEKAESWKELLRRLVRAGVYGWRDLWKYRREREKETLMILECFESEGMLTAEDWKEISQYRRVWKWCVLDKFAAKLDWTIISERKLFSYWELQRYEKCIDWKAYSKNPRLNWIEINDWGEKMDWRIISHKNFIGLVDPRHYRRLHWGRVRRNKLGAVKKRYRAYLWGLAGDVVWGILCVAFGLGIGAGITKLWRR